MTRSQSELAGLREKLASITASSEAGAQQLANEIKDLRARVASGSATTGDRIADYLLVVHGVIGEDDVRPYHELEQQLAGKVGQLFLVVSRTAERHVFRDGAGSSGMPLDSDYHLETHRTMGILSGEGLLLLDTARHRLGLPSEKLVRMYSRIHLEVVGGPFWFGFSEDPSLLGHSVHGGHDTGVALEVLVGDVEVLADRDELFPGQNAQVHLMLRKAARMLGKVLPESPVEVVARVAERAAALDALDRAYSASYGNRAAQDVRTRLQKLCQAARELGLGEELLVKLVERVLS